MDETTQAILKRAAKLKLSVLPLRIMLLLGSDPDAAFDVDGIKLMLNEKDGVRVKLAMDRLKASQLVNIPQRGMISIRLNKTTSVNNTSKSSLPITPHSGNQQVKQASKPPVFSLYQHLSRLMGPDRAVGNAGMEMGALKNMLRKAYVHAKGEQHQMFQAEGIVRDYLTYKVDDWIKANVRQPAMMLQKGFPAYLSVLPLKPLHERRDEVQVYGKRVGYNLKTRQWVVTDDKLPN